MLRRHFLELATGSLLSQPAGAQYGESGDVPYVPSPDEVVAEMLKLAAIKKDDVLYDLGCGDGRIVVTAAKQYGIRGVGIDINPERIQEANENAKSAGVSGKVRFIERDLFKAEIAEASVVTLYLLRSVNLRLLPKLRSDLKPGTRIVSHQFDMGDWAPLRKVTLGTRMLYLWVIPQKTAA